MTLLRIALVMSALLFATATPPRSAHAEESGTHVTLFHDSLEPYGRWVHHDTYGTVWVPASGHPDWRPYTYGRWVYTSEYGWYWDSDEEFGWATYHYGRWVLTAAYGWVWIPDDAWGPAWVDWRYGDGYVGWTPMPPEYRWRNGAFVAVSIDLAAPRHAKSWVFVTSGDFARGDVRARLQPATRNTALLAASVRVTSYAFVNGRVVNRSIDPVRLGTDANVKIAPMRVGAAASASTADRAKVRATGSVPVYRPRLVAKTKLDLDTPLDFTTPDDRFAPPAAGVGRRPDADVHGTVDMGTGIGAPQPRLPGPASGGVGVGVGAGGIGVGGGGGVRLGR